MAGTRNIFKKHGGRVFLTLTVVLLVQVVFMAHGARAKRTGRAAAALSIVGSIVGCCRSLSARRTVVSCSTSYCTVEVEVLLLYCITTVVVAG